MKFEDVLQHLGDFGRYQKEKCLLMYFPVIITAAHALSLTFVAATPDHRCFISGWDKGNSYTKSANESLLRNLTIPWDGKLDRYSQCRRYDVNLSSLVGLANRSEEECNKWVYDLSQYKSSIVSDWNIVCNRQFLKNIAQSIYMAGMLIGSVALGAISDRYGRKRVLFGSLLVQIIDGVAIALAPEYISFVILRFILGAAHMGVLLTGFVIGMEMVGPKGQVPGGATYHLFFTFGYLYLTLQAYFIREWRYLQLSLTLPALAFLPFWWFIPESARWLLQNNREEEARAIIKNVAEKNQIHLPQKMLDELHATPTSAKSATALDLLTYGPRMRRNALITFYNWFVVSLVYYGISFNTSALPGSNDYLNFSVTGLVGIPAWVFCLISMDRWGRRFTLCFAQLICGVTMIGAIFVPANLGWLAFTFVMIGKFGCSITFTIVFNISAEMFPTIVRNNAVGVSSMVSRIGGVITPYVALIGNYTHWAVPPATFGIFAFVGGVLAFWLPETVNRPLPETLEDGENFGLETKVTSSTEKQNGSPPVAYINNAFTSSVDVTGL